MKNEELASAGPAIRAWLQNERRLGVRHVDAALPAGAPIVAAARSSSQPAPARATAAPAPRRESAPLTAPPARVQPPPPPDRTLVPNTPPAASTGRALAVIRDDPKLPPVNTRDLSEKDAAEALAELDRGHVRACRKCVLHERRTQTVFGVGRSRPELVFVGEGPGQDEDEQGFPFVGKAGQLLTRMIAAMTLTREQVYICNIVKCRPPGNRTPVEEEMAACSPYLLRQLAILRPKVIVGLGRPASQSLLATTIPISKLRGRLEDFPPPPLAGLGLPTCKFMPTFHPAYLLRVASEKAKAWDDLQEVMRFLGLKARA